MFKSLFIAAALALAPMAAQAENFFDSRLTDLYVEADQISLCSKTVYENKYVAECPTSIDIHDEGVFLQYSNKVSVYQPMSNWNVYESDNFDIMSATYDRYRSIVFVKDQDDSFIILRVGSENIYQTMMFQVQEN